MGGINPKADLWLDIIEFEEAFHAIQGLPPDQYEAHEIRALRHAAELYQGDLLTGCYEDWCLCERERLRDMHLAILQKLMVYSEAHCRLKRG
ncbi:MAG: hypothetical protein IPG76_00390 [Acidobacteria bacterium]|nr:hypothetical protein [Acidobacteriota bacterium]